MILELKAMLQSSSGSISIIIYSSGGDTFTKITMQMPLQLGNLEALTEHFITLTVRKIMRLPRFLCRHRKIKNSQ